MRRCYYVPRQGGRLQEVEAEMGCVLSHPIHHWTLVVVTWHVGSHLPDNLC